MVYLRQDSCQAAVGLRDCEGGECWIRTSQGKSCEKAELGYAKLLVLWFCKFLCCLTRRVEQAKQAEC